MGNANISGTPPNAKSPDFAKCSRITIADLASITDVSDTNKQKLEQNDAWLEIKEFCAPFGETASLSKGICENIGNPGEWEVYETEVGNGCQYNDCDAGYAVSNDGCNGGCCSIIGKTISCKRKSYTGDPVVCCFNDNACNGNFDNCFQTPEKQGTCDPSNRDLTSATCRDAIEPYCTGKKLFAGQRDWIEIWLDNSSVEINSNQALSSEVYPATNFSPTVVVSERGLAYPLREKQPCLRAIARNVTLGTVCTWDDLQEGEVITTNINPDGIVWSKKLINEVYDKYEKESGGPGSILNGISQDGLNRDSGFYNTLWNLCNRIPLLCTSGTEENESGILSKLCKNVTPDNIIKNPDLLKWCGCHMDSDQYKDYTDTFGITRECTPFCNRLGNIPLIDNNGQKKFCQQNTCIIDDNSINLVNSEISGNVNFTQICPGCGKNNVNRSYTRNSGGSSDSAGTSYFGIKNPQTPIYLTNYYDNVYSQYYDRSNFSSSDLVLEVLYIPDPDDIVGDSTTTLGKLREAVSKGNSLSKDTLGITDVPNFLSNTYGISTVSVIFGLKNDSPCLGYVNAGFSVSGLNTTQKATLLKNNWRPRYFATPSGDDSSYKPLALIGSDAFEVCGSPPSFASASGTCFVNIPLGTYNENIVSETSNKFSSGQANGKVTSNTCTCIMDGVNFNSIGSKIRGSVNFVQECGRSECRFGDKKVSCASQEDNPESIPPIERIEMETALQEEEEKYSSIFLILISFLVLIFIFIIVFELRK